MITTAKLFGTGQITLPKEWRSKVDTKVFILEEVPQGLLIKPLSEAVYYEDGEAVGLHFPFGIEASKLSKELKKASKKKAKK